MSRVSSAIQIQFPFSVFILVGIVALLSRARPLWAADSQSPAMEVIYQSAAGRWMFHRDSSTPGRGCSVAFLPAADGRLSFSVIGPTSHSPVGAIVYTSPDIPAPASPAPVPVELVFGDAPPAKTSALLGPKNGGTGTLIVPIQNFTATIDSITDIENAVGLRLDGRTVFRIGYEGGLIARKAMQDCLAGRAPGNAEGLQATNPGPSGHSRITGQVSLKRALLVSRDYPPKGAVVQLFAIVSAPGQATKSARGDRTAADDRTLFRSVRIHDEQGHFVFDRLPPGEYVVSIAMDYAIEGAVETPTGDRVVTMVGDHVVDAYDETYMQAVRRADSTLLEQPVSIRRHGDAVEIGLKKSKMMINNAFH